MPSIKKEKTSKKKAHSQKKAPSKRKLSSLCELVNKLTPAQKIATESIASLLNQKVVATRKVTKFATSAALHTPTKLKRPLNAYMLFAKDMRKGLKDDNSNMSISETSKELGNMWKGAEKNVRNKYKAQAVKLAEEYKKKKAVIDNTSDMILDPNGEARPRKAPKKKDKK